MRLTVARFPKLTFKKWMELYSKQSTINVWETRRPYIRAVRADYHAHNFRILRRWKKQAVKGA